jgi:hypothetical protein
MSYTPHRVGEYAAFDSELLLICDVLQLTAPARAVARAPRFSAVGGGGQHLYNRGRRVFLADPIEAACHALAPYSSRHEYDKIAATLIGAPYSLAFAANAGYFYRYQVFFFHRYSLFCHSFNIL